MLYNADRRIYRDKLPMRVLRGFYPTEPGKLTSLAAPVDDEAIRSGMVIVKGSGNVNGVNTANVFLKAAATDAPVAVGESKSFYLALHDQDSHDAQAAGGIVGLDCSDNYEVQTGYFDSGVTWAVDMPVTVKDDGEITEATSGDVIIGYITAIGGGANNAIEYVGKTPSTLAANSLVIQFKTAKQGQVKAA